MPETKRYLDPLDRSSEVLFGLIMVLTFTGSLSAAEAGRTEIRAMLIGVLGCNFAWGIIDGILYLMGCWADEGRMPGRGPRISTTDEAQQITKEFAAGLRQPARNLKSSERTLEPPPRYRLGRKNTAVGVPWVCLLPVAIPFLIMEDTMRALRVSNGIAILMLFVAGYTLGRHAGYPPWRVGLAMVGLGIVLVGITIALGG
jgi:hypothetical protein